MQLHNIIWLLTIVIFTIIHYNNEVGAKKSVSNKKHSKHNENHIQHHKQNLVRHQKHLENSDKYKKQFHSNKHQIHHHKKNVLHQIKQIGKKHLGHKKNQLPNNQHYTHNKKRHGGHHKIKLSHRNIQDINPLLKSANCQTGQHPRVVGGHIANEGRFPHVAVLYDCHDQVTTPPSIKDCWTFCGGSIISQHHILTAAHCLVSQTRNEFSKNPAMLLVRVGVHNLSMPEHHYGKIFEVSNCIPHPKFLEKYLLNDVAIIEIKGSITFTNVIQPICINGLHFNYDLTKNRNVIAAGWGRTDQNTSLSNVLKFATLHISDFLNCMGNKEPDENITMFCVSSDGLNDGYTYKGDSGSGVLPLDNKYHEVNIIVGIVSSGGYKDANGVSMYGHPISYTNVTTHARWINDNVRRRLGGLNLK